MWLQNLKLLDERLAPYRALARKSCREPVRTNPGNLVSDTFGPGFGIACKSSDTLLHLAADVSGFARNPIFVHYLLPFPFASITPNTGIGSLK
jgi:hypothetical protein